MDNTRPIPPLAGPRTSVGAGVWPLRLFGVATLAPGALIALAAVVGGPLAFAALVSMTVLVTFLDRVMARAAPHVPEAAEFPAADRLSVTLALVHLALIPLVVWSVAGGAGLSGSARVALFVAAGLYLGQVGNSNAHELIHRGSRGLHALGVAVYVALQFGHHASAHRHVHHRFVATEDDPNSARLGEGFWAFAPRAWAGSFRAGHEIETALRHRAGRGGVHPYVWYLGGQAAWGGAITVAFGPWGLAVYAALVGYAQLQLLLSDYVQHYGLTRRTRADGRIEAAGPAHSWDAAQAWSSALLLNAPRHADHHAHPARPFPALTLPEGAPRLPYGMPVMAVIALWPAQWRRLMDPRARRAAGSFAAVAAAADDGATRHAQQ